MTLYCATSNPGKLREFVLAAKGRAEVRSLPNFRSIPPCVETGSSFEENAVQKALYYGPYAPDLLFADDSGLEVHALGGQPGVRSARYASPGATDEDNNRALIERLSGIPDRGARFVCVIALAWGEKLLGTFRGEVEGQILEQPRGTQGFGYDPLFFFPEFKLSFGELEPERKLEVSHRAKALAQLIKFFQEN